MPEPTWDYEGDGGGPFHCRCRWSSAWHGDTCPQHGRRGIRLLPAACPSCGADATGCGCLDCTHGDVPAVPIRPAPTLVPFDPPASRAGLVARLACDRAKFRHLAADAHRRLGEALALCRTLTGQLEQSRAGRLQAVAAADQLEGSVHRLRGELEEVRVAMERTNEINADLAAELQELRLRAG